MNLIFFDDSKTPQLLPLTFTRPACELRIGIFTIKEKWERRLGLTGSYYTSDSLKVKYPLEMAGENLWINGRVCPDSDLLKAVKNLQPGQALIHEKDLVALHTDSDTPDHSKASEVIEYKADVRFISRPWEIFLNNGDEIRTDYSLISISGSSQPIDDPHTTVYAPENIFVEEGVKIRAAILNAEEGPIYLGKNSQIHEGAIIKGPFSLGEGSHVNMGAKLRGDTTIGPGCKVGGEISNSVLLAHSNKGHEGFLGNSVLGEWCNLGADTNTSNLKNNYSAVKVWSYQEKRFVTTGLQFCGLIMGDHSKAGINTMFNTGTVVGVAANIYGSGFPRNYIPSFAWGGAAGYSTFQPLKVFETAQIAMGRRKKEFTPEDESILKDIFEATREDRFWERK